uniref:RNA helicase n=1 Tax=Syphacia muris TaxID=451379 RepID=A0A0N5AUU5_9BILA
MADVAEEVDYDRMIKAQNRKKKKAGGWQSLGLDHTVFKGIEKKGYRQPTPIQRKAIPLIVDGKDVVAMSRTGSGKTAAFVIPLLQRLKRREAIGVRALLIAPTRELAMQTFKFVKELGRYTGLRAAVLVGGDRIEDQFAILHEKPDILIATPGRLLHLVVEMNLKLSTVEYFVLDEADRLFEMGFTDQLHEVLKRLPDNRQTLLFSATLPKLLVDFAKAGLTDPVLVRLDVDEKISEQLSMVFLTCRSCDKIAVLLHLLRSVIPSNEQTIIFCATMKHVEYLSTIISKAGLDCTFRNKLCPLLIVTDVAARGVDIPLLDNAINFHFPPKAKLFVHRVGRVARAGRSGRSFSLVVPDEIPYLADLFLFLDYAPADANSERALAVDRSFDAAARIHGVEIQADDDTELYKDVKRKRWDRKLMKFVGDNGNESSKKIRTEEGTLLPASFRSGRYEEWQKKQKLAYRNRGSDDETEGAEERESEAPGRSDVQKFNINRKRNRDKMVQVPGRKAARSELKTKDQILKERRRKLRIQAYQKHRREENLKREKRVAKKKK